MAPAYQCAGNAIPNRTARMALMRPAIVVSIVLPDWVLVPSWCCCCCCAAAAAAAHLLLIAILLVWLFGCKRFLGMSAPNDRYSWSTRHKMRKSLYQKHQMQLVARVGWLCTWPIVGEQHKISIFKCYFNSKLCQMNFHFHFHSRFHFHLPFPLLAL